MSSPARAGDDIPGVFLDGGPKQRPGDDPVAFLAACARRYGDIFRLTKNHVQVWDTGLGRDVLRRESDFPLRPGAIPSRRASLQLDRPERWRVARRIAWSFLTPAVVATYRPQLRSAWLDEISSTAGTFADRTAVVTATAHVIWPLIVKDLDVALLDTLVSTSNLRQHSSGRIGPLRRRTLTRRFDEVVVGLTDHVRSRRELPSGDQPADLLTALLLPGERPTEQLSDLEAAQTLAICLDSSMQTTGAAAAWVLHAMANHPELTVHPQNFVKEVLRRTPPIAAVNRTCPATASLGSHEVPQGADVIVAIEGMHHDPRHWAADPTDFDPSRWEAERPHDPAAYLPYGAGPRTCIGMHLANAALEELVSVRDDGWRVEVSSRGRGSYRDNLVWPDHFPITVTRGPSDRASDV